MMYRYAAWCLVLVACILFVSVTCGFPLQPDPEAQEAARINKILAEAIEKAKREGKTRIDIHLDEIENQVQGMDIVTVDVRAQLSDGTWLIGSEKKYDNRQVVAGAASKIPGLGQVVIGMQKGQPRSVKFAAENVFGPRTNEKSRAYPIEKKIRPTMELDAAAFREKTGKTLKQGQIIRINPYFESRVINVTQDKIVIEHLAKDGFAETAPFGKTKVYVETGLIRVRLEPIIGAEFFNGRKNGRIVQADNERFIVDYNHPHAGKSLRMDVKVVNIVKASAVSDKKISWIEDHDEGYAKARQLKKEKIIILYAEWCRWCKKLFAQTFEDPRIRQFSDDFVWVRANSDKDTSLKSLYHQEAFPMIVLTDKNGIVVKKVEGFKDPDAFLALLKEVYRKQEGNRE